MHNDRAIYIHSSVFKSSYPEEMQCRFTPLEASGGQEQYYIRSSWHVERNAIENTGDSQICTTLEASGVQEQYYVRSSWHSEEYNWECSGQSDMPPIRGSDGQEQYYVRSAWHSKSCIRSAWHFEDADVPPNTDILWSRAVLCKVSLTCIRMQTYPHYWHLVAMDGTNIVPADLSTTVFTRW